MSETAVQAERADLGWSLGTLLRGYMKASADALGDLPGGARGFQVLSIASAKSCSNQAEIAEATGLDRTVLTYLIDDLEKAGLVARTPDPNDRRSRRVDLTAAGTARLAELAERVAAAEDRLLAGIPGDDAVALRSILARAANSLNEDAAGVCQTVDEAAGGC
jgi:DNA-binding MarR family transcriptional regulator